MSKSAGDTISSADLIKILPAEIVWFFMFRYAPSKKLMFDEGATLIQIVDEYSGLRAKNNKNAHEKQLIRLCTQGISEEVVSSIPFSHLAASYQAALRNPARTLEIIKRTEHKETVREEEDIILRELTFIDNWLDKWAPADMKFSILENVDKNKFNTQQKKFFKNLSDKISELPQNADGEVFHKTIYSFKDEFGLAPKILFSSIYELLIDKDTGPRAGWFLSILPREWLVKRLKLEV
jgi:lysyl-tRNA synthetase class 1